MTEFEVMKEAILREYPETAKVEDYEWGKYIYLNDVEFEFEADGRLYRIANNRYEGY